MNFTYDSYKELVNTLLVNDFKITNYHNWQREEKSCILRHDVDFNLKKASEFAKFESDISKQVHSTYFVLLNTDFYNVFTKESREALKSIIKSGHEIGLHFDETQYDCIGNFELIKDRIRFEAGVLSEIIEEEVTTVSMHRPSKQILDADLQIEGIINSYGSKFFQDFKYLSDSRMHWKEDPTDYIYGSDCRRLHVLTHPFWYEKNESTMQAKLTQFIGSANTERWNSLNQNFRDLECVVKK